MALLVRPTFKLNGKEERITNTYLYVIPGFNEDDSPVSVWQYYLGSDGLGYHSDKQSKARLILPGDYWFYLSKEELDSPVSKLKKADCMGAIKVENQREQEIILDPHFDLELHLDNFDENHFTPYCFDTNSLGVAMIKFDYELKSETEGDDFVADETCFTIKKDGREVFKGKFTPAEHGDSEFLKLGRHTFEWDGYDNNNKLDTTVFSEGGLSFEVLVKKAGKEAKKDFTFTVERGKATHTQIGQYYTIAGYSYSHPVPDKITKWIDLIIDRAAKRIEVFIAIDFQNERNLQATTYPTFNDLRNLAEDGINKYWSTVIRVGSDIYSVETNVKRRNSECIGVDLYLVTANRFGFSHNSGIIDASFKYLKGYYDANYQGNATARADDAFRETAAHEFGHSVLESFGGRKFSWRHKGTSSFTQRRLPLSPRYPTFGPIDLMFYHQRTGRPPNYYNRVIAVEDDVRRLIALYSIEFDKD